MSALLEVDTVSAGYGGLEIVKGVSMAVGRAEIVTIIGPNGAGKSTLLKAIFGTIPVMRGHVRLEGRDVTGLRAHEMVERGAAFVPQTDNIFPSLSIRENLEMGGFRRSSGVKERIDEVLARFPDLARRPSEQASKLSGGQRQALAMGRALMVDPQILFIDEPSAALSPIMRQEIFDQVKRIGESGVAILMVEQNAREALAISHRGCVLVNGQKVLEQSGRDMLENEDIGRLFLGRADLIPEVEEEPVVAASQGEDGRG
jgi:ABC-type branched-subunit amino acid transport system ATPase component